MSAQRDGQLDLFGTPEAPPPAGVLPAQPSEELVALGRALPSRLHLGTSSWSFPGWAGLVYDREHGEQRLAREGLAAYAHHPIFRSVGLDRTYYGPLSAESFAAYAQAVPAPFRFLVKAHEYLTLLRFPNHPRYGARRGAENPYFLDAAYAANEVVGPLTEGLGEQAGPLVFQFPPQHGLPAPERFADAVFAFADALPRGPLYAFELRNAELLTPAYASALRAASAAHCFNAWGAMPALDAQAAVVGLSTQPALVVRWLLPPQLPYARAKERYAPFDQLVDPDEGTRELICDLLLAGERLGRPGYVIVNNKAEGSSPLSVVALARRFREKSAR